MSQTTLITWTTVALKHQELYTEFHIKEYNKLGSAIQTNESKNQKTRGMINQSRYQSKQQNRSSIKETNGKDQMDKKGNCMKPSQRHENRIILIE